MKSQTIEALRARRPNGESGYSDALWKLHDRLTDAGERDAVREAISVMQSTSPPQAATAPAVAEDVLERIYKSIAEDLRADGWTISRIGRGADSEQLRQAVSKALAAASLLRQPAAVPDGMVLIPKMALDWLLGEGPDHEGKWFGECEDQMKSAAGQHRPYWWRTAFRKFFETAAPSPDRAQLNELLARAKTLPPMTADEIEAQRQSWLHGMQPCEHGIADFEQCPKCRAQGKEGA